MSSNTYYKYVIHEKNSGLRDVIRLKCVKQTIMSRNKHGEVRPNVVESVLSKHTEYSEIPLEDAEKHVYLLEKMNEIKSKNQVSQKKKKRRK